MTAEPSLIIFKQEAKFIAGASKPKHLPHLNLPQIAFVGKSNVGKSSLINAICRRKSLARVSHTPGRTQQINFFSIGEKLILADLPGYGFAKVPLKYRQDWEKLIVHYLQNSENLKLVNVLVDARRGIKENDLKVIELLKSFQKNFQVILTKADKIKNHDQFVVEVKNYLAALGYECNVLLASSRNLAGLEALQASMLTVGI